MRISQSIILLVISVLLIVACGSSRELQRTADLQETRTAVAATNNAANPRIDPTPLINLTLRPTPNVDSQNSVLGIIAFQSDFDIYTIDANGRSRTNLTHNPMGDLQPAWSPDGKHIVFVSDRDGYDEIYVMNADGTQQTRLTYNGATSTSSGNHDPAWSPDGQYIAFTRNGAVFMMQIDGSEQTQLTSSADKVFDWSPAWSSDGQWVVFSRIYMGPGGRGTGADIYIINVDGSGLAPLTNDSGSNLAPAWSPDDQQIAFISDRDGTDHLYIMKTDGGEQSRLTTRSEDERDPSWSPDGQWIVFASYIDLRDQLYIIRTNGSQLTLLSKDVGEGIYDENPAWAPVFAP